MKMKYLPMRNSPFFFELRTAFPSEPFHSLLINGRNFLPDVQRLIHLEKFSYNYFLSNTLNGVKRKYEVFNNSVSNAATFFKQQSCDSGYRGKLVRSSILYTNTPYLVIFSNHSQYY